MTIITLARECAHRCTNFEPCVMGSQYCPFNNESCLDVSEEDWIVKLNTNDSLLQFIDETIGKELEAKYA